MQSAGPEPSKIRIGAMLLAQGQRIFKTHLHRGESYILTASVFFKIG